MKAFGSINAGPWIPVEQVDSVAPGKVRFVRDDSSVVSIQPDGSIGSRDPGTDQSWEQATVSDGIAVYTVEGQCWPFAVRER